MQNRNIIFIAAVIGMAVISRLLPHPADFTPMLVLSLWLNKQFGALKTSIIILISLLLSDALLAYGQHYPLFGTWMLFTYSGFLLIALGAKYLRCSFLQACLVSLYFWLWTNLGVWLTSGIYALTPQGVLQCYIAALPFLLNTIMGSIVWWAVLTGLTSLNNVFTFDAIKITK